MMFGHDVGRSCAPGRRRWPPGKCSVAPLDRGGTLVPEPSPDYCLRTRFVTLRIFIYGPCRGCGAEDRCGLVIEIDSRSGNLATDLARRAELIER